MRAARMGILVGLGLFCGFCAPTPLVGDEAVTSPGTLRDAFQRKLAADNAADRGVFHDDVSSIVAPFFQPGSTLAETRRAVQEQGLPPLQRFHGAADRAGETVFVSRLNLPSDIYAEVHAVLDFDFEGASEGTMRLRKVTAYLQASSM